MRPGSVIAAACLALLSYLRFDEQAYVAAGVFAVLSLGALTFGLFRGQDQAAAPAEAPHVSDVRAAQAAHERYRRGWQRIAVFGFAISIAGAFVFPPMALVVAALSVYSVYRLRLATRSARALSRTVQKG